MIKRLMLVFRRFDDLTGLNIYKFGRLAYLKLEDILNVVYRFIDRFRLFFYKSNQPIKLHLGCGEVSKEGYLNIDWRKTIATNYVSNVSSIPLKNNSVSIIESYHVLEHLSKNEAINTLEKWFKLLEVGGKIVIECPNFDEAVREYLDGNTHRIYNVFGYRRFPGDAHQFGYSFERLKETLLSLGYTDVEQASPTDYHIHEEPCLRVEGYKK